MTSGSSKSGISFVPVSGGNEVVVLVEMVVKLAGVVVVVTISVVVVVVVATVVVGNRTVGLRLVVSYDCVVVDLGVAGVTVEYVYFML